MPPGRVSSELRGDLPPLLRTACLGSPYCLERIELADCGEPNLDAKRRGSLLVKCRTRVRTSRCRCKWFCAPSSSLPEAAPPPPMRLTTLNYSCQRPCQSRIVKISGRARRPRGCIGCDYRPQWFLSVYVEITGRESTYSLCYTVGKSQPSVAFYRSTGVVRPNETVSAVQREIETACRDLGVPGLVS
jgi:hypothetical protein